MTANNASHPLTVLGTVSNSSAVNKARIAESVFRIAIVKVK
jgi:hypothetical protein